MSSIVGFALVTHNQPDQTAYLCHKLSALFDKPPIAIHHDYSQCFLDPAILPSQTRIVKRWFPTRWGDASVIDAYLAALRLLHTQDGPDWTISLSAADYPIKSASTIITDLRNASADGFLDFREVSKGRTQPREARSIASAFQRPAYMELAVHRYLTFSIIPKVILKRVGFRLRHKLYNRTRFLSGGILTRLLSPFSDDFRPYGGDWWHTLNRRAAAVLIEDTPTSRRLRSYYDDRPSPEESYYHTLLLNQPRLRIENDNLRFTIWKGGKPHPELLGYDNIWTMVNSPAHFARKLPYDPALFAAIDKAVNRASSKDAVVDQAGFAPSDH